MNIPHLMAHSWLSNLVSRISSIRSSTWIAIALALVVLASLAIWGVITLAGWLFGVARDGINMAPEATRSVIEQVEKNIPSADQALERLRSIGQPPPPPRDVSGNDPALVARYPGLVRTHWHRDGQDVTVRYAGRAAFVRVLDHYVAGFAAAGYRQNLISASPDEERHEYLKGDERITLTIARRTPEQVEVSLTTRLP